MKARHTSPILLLALPAMAFLRPHPAPVQDGSGPVTYKAMVVSAHPLATESGVRVMREGGNAIDAAVATHFALAVVLPWAGNIGGGGFMVSRLADGTVHTLDFREKAPAAATRDMYLDHAGDIVPGLSWRGHLAAGVPGSVAGMFAMHDSLGKLPISRLVQPAIDLARGGFPLTAREARELNARVSDIREHSTMPNAYTDRDRWAEGDTLRLPELAGTLERIRDQGADGFYKGLTSDLITAEMQRGKGLITYKDLAEYRAVWRRPVRGHYRDYEVIGMAPPSSGGVAVLQLLAGVEPFALAGSGWNRPATAHAMIEAERRVFADRATHLGDPDHHTVPLDGLLDPAYIRSRMADIDPQRATPSDRVGAGIPPMETDHTTHLSVVDPWGNAVSLTTTLNGSYGSCVTVGGAGFLLNNEMDDFSAKPGAPNAYGLVGAEANAIAPGKRMLSSMSPTIVTRGGKLFLVLGTPGGSTIITSVFQGILNVVDHGMDMRQAVTAPRFHHQWLPDVTLCEPGVFTPEDSLALVAMGHRFEARRSIGRMDCIRVLPDGRLEGGADPRGDDAAGGF